MKKLSSNKNLLSVLCLISLLLAILLFIPIIPVSNIYISNNTIYSDDEISKYIPINNNAISIIDRIRVGQVIKTNFPYINSVNTECLKDGLHIIVQENISLGDISFNGTYFQLSYDGSVSDNTEKPSGPLLEGFNFEKLKLGEIPSPMDEEKLKVIQLIAPLLVKYQLVEVVSHVNVSSADKIYIGVGDLEAYIGTTESLSKKIQWLKEVLKEHSSGLLDLSQIEKSQAILTPLT